MKQIILEKAITDHLKCDSHDEKRSFPLKVNWAIYTIEEITAGDSSAMRNNSTNVHPLERNFSKFEILMTLVGNEKKWSSLMDESEVFFVSIQGAEHLDSKLNPRRLKFKS